MKTLVKSLIGVLILISTLNDVAFATTTLKSENVGNKITISSEQTNAIIYDTVYRSWAYCIVEDAGNGMVRFGSQTYKILNNPYKKQTYQGKDVSGYKYIINTSKGVIFFN